MNVGQIRDALSPHAITVSVDADDVLVVTARTGDRLVTLTEQDGGISAEAWLGEQWCDGRTYKTQAGAVRFAVAFLGAATTRSGPRLRTS